MRRRSPARPGLSLLVALAALSAAACSPGPGFPATSPSGPAAATASPSPAPGSPTSSTGPAASPTRIAAAADAFAVVRARSPYFDAVEARDPQRVGQAAWWTATPSTPGTSGGWVVTVSVGWGDCPAGCIDSHVWRWSVAADGATTLVDETGPALPGAVRTGLVASATAGGVGGEVTAGPTCPVVRPGESGCDDRPVADADLVVRDATGAEVARFTTDSSGLFRIGLAPGGYTLEPQPAAGLLGTAKPETFTVAAGVLTFLAVSYDTGIR